MAKKGLGKGLGAIFGEDVVKESKEELEKAKAKRAAAAEEIDEKGHSFRRVSLSRIREPPYNAGPSSSREADLRTSSVCEYFCLWTPHSVS